MDYDSFRSIFHSSRNYSNHKSRILFKLLISKNISKENYYFHQIMILIKEFHQKNKSENNSCFWCTKNKNLMSQNFEWFWNKIYLHQLWIMIRLKVFFILQGTKLIIKRRFCLNFSSLRTYPKKSYYFNQIMILIKEIHHKNKSEKNF